MNNGPGGWHNGQCYDVDSSTNFQLWGPGGTSGRTDEAVDSVWAAGRMTRGGIVFQSFYKAGYSTDACGQWYGGSAPGHDMSQWGTQACAVSGLMWNGIVRRYYFYSGSAPSDVVVLDDSPGATEYYESGDGYHLNVYALNRGGAVYEKYYRSSTGTWHGWQPLGGVCTGGLGALSYSDNHLWVFCRGANAGGSIFGRRYSGSSWQPWVDLGGSFQSGPSGTEYLQPGDTWHLNVYALGWNGNIYENWYHTVNGTWSGWLSIGSPSGGCTSAPGSRWRTEYELYVFCRGTDGAIWHRKWTGYGWEAWASLGGGWTSGPGATDYYQPGDTWHQNVYANKEAGAIWQRFKGSGGWSSWSSLQGVCQAGPSASDLPYATAYLYVICRGDPEGPYGVWAGYIWYRRWTGSSWDGWVSIGKP